MNTSRGTRVPREPTGRSTAADTRLAATACVRFYQWNEILTLFFPPTRYWGDRPACINVFLVLLNGDKLCQVPMLRFRSRCSPFLRAGCKKVRVDGGDKQNRPEWNGELSRRLPLSSRLQAALGKHTISNMRDTKAGWRRHSFTIVFIRLENINLTDDKRLWMCKIENDLLR